MDVHNDTDRYFQTLQNQKETLQKAKKRQGQRPRDWKPREEMYLGFMMALVAGEQRERRDTMRSSFIPPAYLPCTTPLAELRRVTIRDLQLETHHRGTYLLLRATTPPRRITAIMVLVEDDCADVVMLQLYQQEEEDTRETADIVNVGTILLVKEPYFKVMASGEYGLRVDHLSDVINVDKDDPRIPGAWRPRALEVELSAESLKIKGNSSMGKGKYWQAITEYSESLSQPATVNEIEIIKRNRSLAFLKTKQFDAALSDTGFPSFGSNPTEKALFRAAEALYFLRRFSECYEVLELLRTKFPNNKQALVVLNRARSRCSEQSTGDYNFKLLQAEAKKLRPPQLDHATYIGPVEIRKTEKKGRGLFVTKAVKAGDLLLCEKAFGHAYVTESDEGNSKVTLLINPEKNRAFMGGQSDLIRILVQKLYHNPSVARAFTTLHHGTYEAVSTPAVDGKAIVDTFLVEQIMSFNVFGCPLSSLIIHKNLGAKKSKEPTAYHSCGIWTQASYINHSCTSNACRAFIGDMMIVRATQDLEPGTEITFWYRIPDGTTLKDSQEAFKSWEFVCDCAICQDAKETKAAVIAERQKLLERMKRVRDSSTPNGIQTDKVERLLKALNNTYTRPADEVPRLLLWDPQLLLARVYIAQKNITKSLEAVGKTLTALGFIVVGADSSSAGFRVVKWGLVMDHLVEVFLHARSAFEAIGAWENSMRAEKYAIVTYRIVIGEDTSFKSTYGR
ncbi:uncharacterized protein BDZ99DRAFT_577577 [Mytilinidion resinicola]|uniref:SET domain-containing protein n=1 Tax=Mytilinidion resinicola TaxID=574789 RepID=A0A6A6Y0V3_9PEZI|nr:uncharacterized protein BDZ99DRAFT_577577 [Mytilinidion resinicola]KAF2801437.1 hypothetical protein BDZ99DRAFT_577577 [Mytilinidion resinicola]